MNNQSNQNEVERIVDWLNESLQISKRTMIDKIVDNIIDRNPVKSLVKVRDGIAMAKKPKMRIVEHYLCDNCDKVIVNPEEGYVIHGNIYLADPNEKGGLIGDNFPKEEAGSLIKITDVKETVLCNSCFTQAIALHSTPEQTAKKSLTVPEVSKQAIVGTKKIAESIFSSNRITMPEEPF